MRLRIVGCCGSMSGPHSCASCYLFEAEGTDEATGCPRTWRIVTDLGPGSFGELWKHTDPLNIDGVFFSHTHADHIGDIVSLHVYYRWGPAKGAEPLLIGGPADVRARLRQIDGSDSDDRYKEFNIKAFTPRSPLKIGPFTLTPHRSWHTDDSFGLRIEGPSEFDQSRSVSAFFTGDTDLCDTIVKGATGVDLLLSEAGFTDAETVRGIHLSGTRAGELATQSEVGRLVLTHIQPWTNPAIPLAEAKKTYDGQIDLATPGTVYSL